MTTRVAANGITFSCRIEGPERAPWIMFSNSLTCNMAMWDGQAALFRDRYRILRYDTRGHGQTSCPEGAYTMALLVEDARALMDHFGIEQCHFVGLSLGGMTAIGLALTCPERLISMAVCNSRADAPLAYREIFDQRVELARTQGMEPLVEPTIERWFTPGFRAKKPPVLDQVRAMIRSTPVSGYVGCVRAIQGLDYLPKMDSIAVRTLFLAGDQDAGTPAAGMRAMHAAVKGSRYVELAPAAHISNIEQPEAFNAAIAAFLAGS